MWVVAAYCRTRRPSRLAWFESWQAGSHLALSLHSSNEPGELSQWPRHDDSTINMSFALLLLLLLLLPHIE